MRRRFHFMANARAGRGRQGLSADVANRLLNAGCELTYASADGEAACLLETADIARRGLVDAIVAAGGDGTIRLAAKAVAGTCMPLGVIPLGTGNVLAHEIGLPHSAADLAEVLQLGPAIPINTATANGELFILMAGIGFDGRVIASLNQTLKAQFGKLAYGPPLLSAIRRPADEITVDIDGTAYCAAWVIVTNASRYGGRYILSPGQSVTKPGLDVVLFGDPRNGKRSAGQFAERLTQVFALGSGRLDQLTNRPDSSVRRVKGARIAVTCPHPVPVQLDGDAFLTTPLTVLDAALPLNLIVPFTANPPDC